MTVLNLLYSLYGILLLCGLASVARWLLERRPTP